MPLIHNRELRKDSKIGIWEVTESESELSELYPASDAELEKLQTFSHSFRRTQYLASRLLLHTLLPGSKIIYDENGKPFPADSTMHISISHSGNYIAIMTDCNYCGIDIETIHPKIEKIAGKFLSGEEIKTISNNPSILRLHIYWCVKEAIYKVEGRKNISLKSDIFVEEVSDSVSGSVRATIKHDGTSTSRIVNYEQFENCMLAWTEQTEI
ncbi:hypothetical protein BH09BAC5_BH09BAC5_24810 [soil metagenome]